MLILACACRTAYYVDVDNGIITYYDSLVEDSNRASSTATAVSESSLVRYFRAAFPQISWDVSIGGGTTQDNDFDCGIITALNVYYMAQLKPVIKTTSEVVRRFRRFMCQALESVHAHESDQSNLRVRLPVWDFDRLDCADSIDE